MISWCLYILRTVHGVQYCTVLWTVLYHIPHRMFHHRLLSPHIQHTVHPALNNSEDNYFRILIFLFCFMWTFFYLDFHRWFCWAPKTGRQGRVFCLTHQLKSQICKVITKGSVSWDFFQESNHLCPYELCLNSFVYLVNFSSKDLNSNNFLYKIYCIPHDTAECRLSKTPNLVYWRNN